MTMRCKNRGEFHPLSLVSIGLVLMATILGIYACSPNGSSTSGTQSGTGGTGNFEGNWVVSVAPAQSTMVQSVGPNAFQPFTTLSSTTVMITVTGPSGTPAPPNSTVFLTCSNGAFGFRSSGSGLVYEQPITTETLGLNNGRNFITFFAGFSPGTATINVTYQGSTGSGTITISPVPTTTTKTTTDR
jgi:hypothetical protein